MSLGGNAQQSSSQAQSTTIGGSQGTTFLDPAQQAAQQNLIGGFNDVLSGSQGVQNYYGNQQNQLLNQNQLYAQQGVGGQDAAAQFAQQQNPYLQNQIDQFGQDISRQFGILNQQLGGQYQQAGQRGSSRQGIAQAQGLDASLRNYVQGVTDLRSQAYQQQQQAAFQSVQQNLAERALQQQAIGQGLTGIGQAQQNLFQPFQIGSQVIGAPSVLSQQSAFNQSQSTAQSKGKGAGFSIGFGQPGE